ncbi:MAG: Elongation factor Ts [Candidatus Amesbacteria bacterium GW2011_GWA2_42_12]|uniref:Elongation factor Ts n=1 Tax=Candidatus Amesbacteria bacterium GW2011_GWA2_42_12 TaxID=1618356 RepID=A0A0G0Y8I6_9BACT|nr:MAG: Elongation factor Ts [Candidatus Amesbacteria bacterium GW2011_GWA2_42_12]
MIKVNLNDLKKLREATDAGVADCRQALEEANGKMEEAMKILRKKGIEKAAKKSEREVKAGRVFSYVHHTGRLGSLVSLACETDFVAKTEHFQNLGKELALHVASAKPASVEELLDQEYVRDPSKKISELIKETVGVLGENIQVVDFSFKSV